MSELNTYGVKPNPQKQWKLFDVDGFQLLATLDESDGDDGDGYGIRYSTALDGDVNVVSFWIGARTTSGDINAATYENFESIFNDMDAAAARKALQQLLAQVGPVLAKLPVADAD